MSTPTRIPETLPAGPAAPVAGAAGAPIRQASLWKDAWYRYVRNRAAVVAGAVFLGMVAFCFIYPAISPHDPYDVQFSEARQDPSLEHPLGTDTYGRDLLTRAASDPSTTWPTVPDPTSSPPWRRWIVKGC